MNLQTYVPLALRTEKPLPTSIARLMHAALGIETEIGEFSTVVKRVTLYGKNLDEQYTDAKGRTSTLRLDAGEEIGDAAWYIAIAIDAISLNPNEVAPMSIMPAGVPLDELALDLSSASGRMSDIVVYAKRRADAELTSGERTYLMNTIANLTRLLNNAAGALGLSLSDLLDENIAKLKKRYAEKYTDEAAEARADKGGLDARNS